MSFLGVQIENSGALWQAIGSVKVYTNFYCLPGDITIFEQNKTLKKIMRLGGVSKMFQYGPKHYLLHTFRCKTIFGNSRMSRSDFGGPSPLNTKNLSFLTYKFHYMPSIN